MKYPLNYIETQMKALKNIYPEYYEKILSGDELFDFIIMLNETYASQFSKRNVLNDSVKIISGDYFDEIAKDIIQNGLDTSQKNSYRRTFEIQNEADFLFSDYDISVSRLIRYMPAQWHQSSSFQIYFPSDGPCDIHLHDASVIHLKKGNILILAPNVVHATPCYDDEAYLEYFLMRSSSFNTVFSEHIRDTSLLSRFFRDALKAEPGSVSYILFDTENNPEISQLIDAVRREFLAKQPYSNKIVNSLISVLFSLLLRNFSDTAELYSQDHMKWNSRTAKIFAYIRSEYNHVSLSDVANECGLSPKQTGRVIQNYFDMSFTELITQLKMEKAAALLSEKNASVKEISAYLGYSDVPSFYRAYKKYYHEPPQKHTRFD